MKRIFDIAASAAAIVILALPMLAIYLAVRLGSRGGGIFRQRRAGLHGKPFTMLKFRTMRIDADPYGASPHGPEDSRLTRVGRLLRETSLDELPQLFNVLAGSMSLVGPRPLYERQAAGWDAEQRRRLDVKPGLTGYAQVLARGEATIEDKIALDLEYVDKHTFLLDLKLIGLTVVKLFAGGQIYEKRYSRDKERENHS